MKEAALVIAIVMNFVSMYVVCNLKSQVKTGLVKTDGEIYQCKKWNYYPTKMEKKK